MKLLLCHNYYQQEGGEDQSFASESWLLESRGHEVIRYTRHNNDVQQMGRIDAALKTIWNRQTYRDLRGLIRLHRPDVMHCTNTFPLISPAAYYAARAMGVPVVQSLRNYRLICANGLFMRDGRVCVDCLGKAIPWPAVAHKCYRDSRAASAAVAAMISSHRAIGTWHKAVDLYIANTEFSREKFIAAGLPSHKIFVKPNFVHPDPELNPQIGEGAVFVGRLAPEKGLETLLAAWAQLREAWPLTIVGDGPLAEKVQAAARNDSRIRWLGRRTPEEAYEIIGAARALILPSICYETFGRTIVEAFAKGTPAIVSRMGAMAELVDHGRTGLSFHPSDSQDLAAQVRKLFTADVDHLKRMKFAARAEYEQKYSADRNYEMLLSLYQRVLPDAACPQPARLLNSEPVSSVASELDASAVLT